MKLLAVAPVAVLAFLLTFLVVHADSPAQGTGQFDWHYDGISVSWNCHDFTHYQWAYFLISYDDGYPTFESADSLGCTSGQFPGYAMPDPPSRVGCGWQHWIAYRGSSLPLSNATYHPTLNPPSSLVLARGDLYVCGSGGL